MDQLSQGFGTSVSLVVAIMHKWRKLGTSKTSQEWPAYQTYSGQKPTLTKNNINASRICQKYILVFPKNLGQIFYGLMVNKS